jgi:hypothetical protein
MSTSDLAKLPTEELVRRRGELAQGLQHAALEGLTLDDDDTRAVLALDAELRRRGMDPQQAPSGASLD